MGVGSRIRNELWYSHPCFEAQVGPRKDWEFLKRRGAEDMLETPEGVGSGDFQCRWKTSAEDSLSMLSSETWVHQNHGRVDWYRAWHGVNLEAVCARR